MDWFDMNDNMKKWVEALRSGKYKQATNQLRDRDGYCCLGVICDIYRRETGRGKWHHNGNFEVQDRYLETRLDMTFREWLGLSYNDEERYIILNDEESWTFPRIADAIEKDYI